MATIHDLNPDEIQLLSAIRALPPRRRKNILPVLLLIVARLRLQSQDSDLELVLDD